MKLAFGLILAAISSVCFAASYFGQHRAITHLDRLTFCRPLWSLHLLLKNREWLFGYMSGWIGWGIYVAALVFAPLSIVQALSAGVIGILALVARHTEHPITRRERIAVAFATIGVVLVLASARTTSHPTHPSNTTVLVFVGTALVVATALFFAIPRHLRGVALGVASGLCYGAGDVATKAAVLGAPALIPVFLTCAALGFVTLQLSYQRVSLLASAGLSSLLTNSIPVVAGVLLFGELPPHGIATWMRNVGFAIVIIGAVGLANNTTTA